MITKPDAAPTDGNTTGQSGAVVTEEQLLKSLHTIEGKKEEPVQATAPTVQTATVTQTTGETVAQGASEPLRKALEVSTTLSEVVSLIGKHVDVSIGTLQKSINDAATRDLAIVGAMEAMNKSISDLREAITAFGNAPAGGAKSTTAATTTTTILQKAIAPGTGDTGVDPVKVKKQVKDGFEKLVKSLPVGSAEQSRMVNAAVIFETSGQISDELLQKALDAGKPA